MLRLMNQGADYEAIKIEVIAPKDDENKAVCTRPGMYLALPWHLQLPHRYDRVMPRKWRRHGHEGR